jgi:hypothetical protein
VKPRTWGFIALAALIIADLVLVALALRPTQVLTTATLPPPELVQPSSSPSPSEPTPTAETAQLLASGPPVPANQLVAADNGTLLLVIPGQCANGGAEGWQQSAGATEWTPWEVPGAVMTRFSVTGPTRAIFATASGPECLEQLFYTATGPAQTWSSGQPAPGVFYLQPNPDGTQTIGTVAGPAPSPCEAGTIALAATDTTPALLCANGQVAVSNDGGINWELRGTLNQGRAMAFGSTDLLYALTDTPECSGIAVASSGDGGTTWSVTGCAEGATSSASVALAAEGNSVVVVDASRVTYRSSDGGRTFSKSGA